MAWLDPLLALDTRLFVLLNRRWDHPWLDKAMPVLTDLHKQPAFLIIAAVGLAYWLGRDRSRALKVLFGLALVIALTDAVSHRVLKPAFKRRRPTAAGIGAALRTHSHAGLSFPSNHAANCFAGASFLVSMNPALAIPLYTGAAAVAYSRVYVGVHYPLDVAAGALLGLCIGIPVARLFAAARWAARAPPRKR